MQKDPTLKVIHMPGLNVAYWAFNAAKPPLDKKEVRQALAWRSIATRSSRTSISAPASWRTTLIPPPCGPMTTPSRKSPMIRKRPRRCSPPPACTTPLDIDLWYQPVSRPYNPNGKRIGEMMQADLAKIGVNAKLVTFEWGEYRKRMANHEEITGQYGWTGDNGDPDNFFFLRGCPGGKAGGNNPDNWCNAEFDDLLVKARTIADQAERAKLYHRMQEIEHDEAPELLLAHSVVYESMRANVVGYKQSPFGRHTFEGVDLQVGRSADPGALAGRRGRPRWILACSSIFCAGSR